MAFVDLQNGFYNALSQGLGFPVGSPFQLLQPSPPLLKGDNAALWSYFNNIPPNSVTSFFTASAGAQFLSNYKGVISALQAPANPFKQDVGPECFAAWQAFIATVTPRPPANQIPGVFFNWAMIEFPDQANIGATDLGAMLLDPVSTAVLALMPYVGANNPDWSIGYDGLSQLLANSPSRAFNVNSSSMNTSLKNAWSQSNYSGLFGLWSGSSSDSDISNRYAGSSVEIEASFDHVLTFAATPGSWYTSSALGLAFANQGTPPWRPSLPINWNSTFSSANGNMARFTGSLIVASGMRIQVVSGAQFSGEDQKTILHHSSAGLWPFYSTNSGLGVTTSSSFTSNGQMTTSIMSMSGVPIVLGCNVLPASQFVGHAAESTRLFAKLLAANA